MFDDSIRYLLGFDATILGKEYNLSTDPVDIISFDNIFIETDIAKRMISKEKRSGIIMKFKLSVSPGYIDSNEVFTGICWKQRTLSQVSHSNGKMK